MKERKRRYKEISPLEFLVLRDQLGLGKYRKRAPRNKQKRKIIIDLALKKIEEAEKNNFILIGYRRRKLII